MWVTHTPLLCTYIVSLVGAAAALIERVRCWYLTWVTMWVTHTRSDGQCIGTRFIASAGWEGLAYAVTWAHRVRPSRRCPDQCVKPHHRAPTASPAEGSYAQQNSYLATRRVT